MKKFLYTFLFAFMLSAVMAISCFAITSENIEYEYGDIKWKVTLYTEEIVNTDEGDTTHDEGEGGESTEPSKTIKYTASINGVTLSERTKKFDMPSLIEYNEKSYTVTKISKDAFKNNTNVFGLITLPQNLTQIESGAFYGTNIYGEIVIPDTLTALGDEAFRNCYGVKSVVFPESITSIPKGFLRHDRTELGQALGALTSVTFKGDVTSFGNECFYGCSSLNNITFSENITEIGANAFYRCRALDGTVNLPVIETLGNQAFQGCSGIKEVYIGSANFNANAFFSCTALEKITVSEENKNYTSSDGILFKKDKSVLYIYPAAKEGSIYEVPDGIKEIATQAFYHTENLKKVIISSSVTSIGDSAFESSGIESMFIPSNVTTVGSGLCRKAPNLIWIFLDSNVKNVGRDLVAGASSVREVISKGKFLDSSCGVNSPINVTESYNCKNHRYGYLDTEATCEEEGKNVCVICHSEQSVPALGHNGKIIEKSELSCTTDQYTLIECERCKAAGREYILKLDEIKTTGHKKDIVFTGDGLDSLPAFSAYQCNVCHKTFLESFHADVYTVGDINKDGKIDFDDSSLLGMYIGGKQVSINKFSADANGDGNIDIYDLIALISHIQLGTAIATDTSFDCNHAHKITVSLVHSDCIRNGLEVIYCDDCGALIEQKITDTTGHNFERKDGGLYIEPSCTSAGYYQAVCSVCNTESQIEIDPTGHSGTWWTLDSKGFEYRYCQTCHTFESNEVDYSVLDQMIKQISPYYDTYYTTDSTYLVKPILENYEKPLTQVQVDAMIAEIENVLPKITYKVSDMPIIYLETDKKYVKQNYTWANIAIAYYDNDNVYHSVINYDASIKIRGNSTNNSNKYPFNIKFTRDVDLLGLGEGKKYCLLANLYDKTLLRNALAFDFSKSLGIDYTPSYRFAELYIDGVYNGCYMITTPGDEISETRADLNENTDFLLGLDPNRDGHLSSDYVVSPLFNIKMYIESPKEITPEGYAALFSIMSQIDYAIMNGNWEEIQKYIDVENIAKYYIFHEIVKDKDLLYDSTRFYIKDGKLCGGPAWDFDLSMGNVNQPNNLTDGDKGSGSVYWNNVGTKANGIPGNSATGTWADSQWENTNSSNEFLWFGALFEHSPEFVQLVKDLFIEYQDRITILYEDSFDEYGSLVEKNLIDSIVDTNYISFINDSNKFSIRTRYNSLAYDDFANGYRDYKSCVERLRGWLKERNEWLLEYYFPTPEDPPAAEEQTPEVPTPEEQIA